mmetsp:Transcript_65556/g.166122  ORF Transcript_65556/g.166122 Transcript_65556/m.166122 type:complete len:604 (-) Transcript_65556:6-1817(-)
MWTSLAVFISLLSHARTQEQCSEDTEEQGLLQARYGQAVRSGSRSNTTVSTITSTCTRPLDRVYVEHLRGEGENCWDQCGQKGGYCDWCGIGNVCCAPNGEGDSGCRKEVCEQTPDWSGWHNRRRHHFCGVSTVPSVRLTYDDALVGLPVVTTESQEAFDSNYLRLSLALTQHEFSGVIGDVAGWFDFIPGVGGYTAQYKLPEGDLRTTSCDLSPFLGALKGHEQLDIIGSGFSYYIRKTHPQKPSLSMTGCKCAQYHPVNKTVTVCAASTFGDGLTAVAPWGRKLPTHGSFHYLSYGGAIAVFNHGSDRRFNSLVDTIEWMEIFDLKTSRFRIVRDLQDIKRIIADRSYVMIRANIKTELDSLVISFAGQSKGRHTLDEIFLASLDDVQSLDYYQHFKHDGSYVTEAFGYRPLTLEQLNVMAKRPYAPHTCAKRYRDCRFADFFRGGDEIKDSDSIFQYSFDLNGHVVKASEVEAWWQSEDTFGTRLFGSAANDVVRGTARGWEFELAVEGVSITQAARLWHSAIQSWPEAQRVEHTMMGRRGKCNTSTCWTWMGFYIRGEEEDFVALWNRAMSALAQYNIYVHLGKERMEARPPAKEVFVV